MGIVVAILILITIVIILPEGRYLLRAGYEQSRILLRRQPIPEVIADPDTPVWVGQMLEMVLAARNYAADSLGLEVGETYTSYAAVGRDTLLLVLSASAPHALRAYTWRYPIVGVVPYKGFFRPSDARRAARRLSERGLDVYMRSARAYSTLGWFEDPLLSTLLQPDTVEVVSTIVHEVTHNTLFLPGQVAFNESFANFVGYRGAERFFRARGDEHLAARAAEGWQAQLRSYRFFEALAARLDSVYTSGQDSAAIEQARQDAFAWARDVVGRPDWEINNAVVIAVRLYRSQLDAFDLVYEEMGRDIVRTVTAIVERVRGSRDPFAALSSP